MPEGLRKICERAMSLGTDIDLSHCPYGETTGPCSFINRPANYYFFLAGFVRSQRLTRVLEIGTNYGGSIMSISNGLHEDDMDASCLLTIDIVSKNEEGFKRYPHIKRIVGDSLDEVIAMRAAGFFGKGLDLLYIDSVHEYEHTKRNIAIYAERLNPRYIILDDIRQCDDMRKLWAELSDKFAEEAFDASDVSIRKGAGFGVIRWKR